MSIYPSITDAKQPKALKRLFFVEIDGFSPILFTKGQFPKVSLKTASFQGGGQLSAEKRISGVEYDELEFEKGILENGSDTAVYDWLNDCIDQFNQLGKLPSDYMKDIDVGRMDITGSEVRRFSLSDCFPTKVDFGEGDGSSDDNDVEKITICFRRFKKIK